MATCSDSAAAATRAASARGRATRTNRLPGARRGVRLRGDDREHRRVGGQDDGPVAVRGGRHDVDPASGTEQAGDLGIGEPDRHRGVARAAGQPTRRVRTGQPHVGDRLARPGRPGEHPAIRVGGRTQST